QACGTPVIAFGRGGVLETVRGLDHPEPTGVFYAQQTPESLIAAVDEFESQAHLIFPDSCRKSAERFSTERFKQEVRLFIEARVLEISMRHAPDHAAPRPTITPASVPPVYPAAVPMKHA
nr:glycosyltransferase family 4 protein [Pseudomonas sp.]